MQNRFKTLRLTNPSGAAYREKRNELIIQLAHEGHTLQAIGEACGLSRERVSQILETFDVPRSAVLDEIREQDLERIQQLAAEGKNMTAIARELGYSVSKIYNLAKTRGIQLPGGRGPGRDGELDDLIDLLLTGEYKVRELALMSGRNAVALSVAIRKRLGLRAGEIRKFRKQMKGTA